MPKSRAQMIADLESWITALRGKTVGRVALSNLRHDYRTSRLSHPVVKAFLDKISKAWAQQKSIAQRKVRRKVLKPDQVWQTAARSFSMLGPQVTKGTRNCSRVVSAADLIANNIDPEECLPIEQYPTAEHLAYIRHRWEAGIAVGAMRGANPYAWVTKTAALQGARKKPNPADHARLILGLKHWDQDERLMEVRYPVKCFALGDLRLPTCMDGCPSLIFRSRTGPDGWGRAVRLDTLKDGAPEAVHWAIPFTQAFDVDELGVLSPLRLRRNVWRTWEAVVSTLPDPWTDDAIDELKAYV